MINHYEVPEVVEIGKAQDVILGSSKLVNNVYDGPIEDPRESHEMSDDD